MSKTTRAIRPDDFEIIAQIPGIAAVARDENLRVLWYTPSFSEVSGMVKPSLDLIGTTLSDILPKAAVLEREIILRQVLETGETLSHFQFSADSRVLCTVFPLDEEAFGHRGIFAVVKDVTIHALLSEGNKIPVLSTPLLLELNELSSRELEVLHYVASGMTTHQIAMKVCRADKTIEHHVNSIHGKLGTHSRAQLVRFASERGIQSFTDEEWASIVKGARLVRKEGLKAKAAAEVKPVTKTEAESS